MSDFLKKYSTKFYAPDLETGSPEPAAPPPAAEPAAPEPKRSIRQELEHQFAESNKAPAAKARAEDGKFTDGAKKAAAKPQRAVDEMRSGTEEAAPAADAEAAPVEGAVVEPEKPQLPPPAALSKEAKEAWATTPPAIQAAFIKREADVQKGVNELKQRYADIDQALAPHIESIRKHGHTPAQAVQQMFAWFQALTSNPDVAFPALVKSFNYDARRMVPQQQQQPAQAAAAPTGTPEQQAAAAAAQPMQLPPELVTYLEGMNQYVGQLEKKLSEQIGAVQSTFQVQQEAKTQEVLQAWSQNKPHFEKVRGLMSQLIASGAVPLKDGRVDLDGAYEKAVRLDDETWQADQQTRQIAADAALKAKLAADKAAEQVAADKARKAGASLAPGAPGVNSTQALRPKKKMSVRESLDNAIAELRS